MSRTKWISLLCSLALLACSGKLGTEGGPLQPGAAAVPGGGPGGGGGVGQPHDPGQPGSGGGPSNDPSADPNDPTAPGVCAPRLPQRLVLLSDLQHQNAIESALGQDAVDPEGRADAETKTFAQKGLVVSTSLVHDRLGQAEHAALSLEDRLSQVTGCQANADAACARGFLERFAEDAFRRPVQSEEIDDLMVVFETGAESGFESGLRLAVEAVLSAPSFTYRSELGVPDGQGNARLTPHELASALSFMLTDSPPDSELARAVEMGELETPAQVQAQVDRLLEQEAVQESLSKTLMAAWQVGNLFGTVKDPGLFPDYSPALQSSMYQETEAFVQAVLWTRDAPVSELLTSRESFVDEALAELYDVPYTGNGAELVATTLPPERAGLLTQASLLATLSRTDNTSVVARGLFVRGALLCLPKVPGPPETLANEIQELLEADMTERERADVRATTQPCGGCHAQFDPFGLLLEHFDPLGRERSEIEGEPIETRVSLDGLASFTGEYDDAVMFAEAAAQAPEFTTCVARHLVAYATADDGLEAKDCQVTDLLSSLSTTEPTMRDLVRAAASSEALSIRSLESAP